MSVFSQRLLKKQSQYNNYQRHNTARRSVAKKIEMIKVNGSDACLAMPVFATATPGSSLFYSNLLSLIVGLYSRLFYKFCGTNRIALFPKACLPIRGKRQRNYLNFLFISF